MIIVSVIPVGQSSCGVGQQRAPLLLWISVIQNCKVELMIELPYQQRAEQTEK